MNRIKTYLEETIKTDSALAAVYDSNKFDDCCKYIIAQARKLAKDNCAIVEEEVVYKWARDFYYGDINNEEKPIEVETVSATKIQEKKEAPKVTKKKEVADDEQPSLFDFGE